MPIEEQQSPSNNSAPDAAPNAAPVSRRDALLRTSTALLGLAGAFSILGACSSSAPTRRLTLSEPGATPPGSSRRSTEELLSRWGNGSGRRAPQHRPGDWQPLPDAPAQAAAPNFSGLIRRSNWSKGNPVPNLMDRMLPIDKVTVHHDGMSAFTNTSLAASASRIEAIRRAHRNQNWGDIGYHFLIDPSGRVWEGRPLAWQGAHVKDNNHGNIGVCMLGNYEQQRLTDRQSAALDQFLATTLRNYRISRDRVYTHREFSPTACPGRSLQARMDSLRTSRSSALASL